MENMGRKGTLRVSDVGEMGVTRSKRREYTIYIPTNRRGNRNAFHWATVAPTQYYAIPLGPSSCKMAKIYKNEIGLWCMRCPGSVWPVCGMTSSG